MNLKIGDKVKMTKRGFKFYSDVEKSFQCHSVGRLMNSEHFTRSVCELFAIHGVGTVTNYIPESGIFEVRWNYKIDGIKIFYTHYYESKDIKKLNLFDKLKFKIQGRI
jgi:hypothetical protein